jgi:hypothetical protein
MVLNYLTGHNGIVSGQAKIQEITSFILCQIVYLRKVYFFRIFRRCSKVNLLLCCQIFYFINYGVLHASLILIGIGIVN